MITNEAYTKAFGIASSCALFITLFIIFTSSTDSLENLQRRVGGSVDGMPSFGVPPTLALHSLPEPTGYKELSTSERNVTLVNATFVILARNSDIWGILQSMRDLEDRFNKHYHYPYVFLNDVPFDETFEMHTSALASGPCLYGLIDAKEWHVIPPWIQQQKAQDAMSRMASSGIVYGGSLSYRQMCRYQSGFFWRHPLLKVFRYYMRIEPNVKYFCDINYDPFKLMERRKVKYGWTLSILEYKETVTTLWDATKRFIEANPQYLASPNLLNWVSSDQGKTYNLCHFWSNFEIGDLDFWRGEAYTKYFEHLDKLGGFFYERWGDAPIHSIAAALFLRPEEIHFFQDIGYRHAPVQQCPATLPPGQCSCDPKESFETHRTSCTPRFKMLTGFEPSTPGPDE